MNRLLLVAGAFLALIACREADLRKPTNLEKAAVAERGKQAMDAPVIHQKGPYQAGEVLVKFKPGTAKKAVQDFAEAYGLALINPLSLPDVYLFRTLPDADLEQLIRKMKQSPVVEYAEPNFTYKAE